MWLKPAAYAKHCDVSRRTVWTWIPLGLPAVKVGGTVLIPVEKADNFLLENFGVDSKVDEIVKDVEEKHFKP